MAIFPATVNYNSPLLSFFLNTVMIISMLEFKADGRFFRFAVNSRKHKACPPLSAYII